MKRTDHKCVVCHGHLMQREESARNPNAGPFIYGPGEKDNWGMKFSDPFCPQCGIRYDPVALIAREPLSDGGGLCGMVRLKIEEEKTP